MCAGPVSLATTNLLLFIKPASSEIEIALGPKDLPRLFDALNRLKGDEENYNYQKAIDILEKILSIVESWFFSKDLKRKDPNWILDRIEESN